MKIFSHIEEIQNVEPCCIALGNFDGVHVGHQALIMKTVERAKEREMKSLFKPTTQDNLEDISSQAMFDTLSNHSFVLFVRDGRTLLTYSLKIVGCKVTVLDQGGNFTQMVAFVILQQLDQGQLILEMVKYQEILI